MPIRDAEAIVLRYYALSEADRIVVFLTREQGTLRAVAQGVRKPRSRLAGCLEPMTHVQLQFYAKEGSNLSRIWQCEMLHSYLGRNPTLDRVYGYGYLAELIQEMVPENSSNALMFRLMLAVLETGERIGVSAPLLRYFELWVLKLNGWLPVYDSCPGCGKCVKDTGFFVWPESGQGRCRDCAENRGIRIGSDAALLLRKVLELSPQQFASISQPASAIRELEHLAQNLIEWHLEKRLKSYSALKEVFGSS